MTAPAAKPEWAQSKHDKANAARIAAGEKPRRRRWPWILLALVVLAIIAFIAFNMLQPPPEAPVETAAAETVMQVTTSEVTSVAPQTLAQQVKVTGSLGPQRQTQVASQVSARAVAVMARPGDAVREGDVLVQLDTESLRIQLDQQTSTAAATRAQLVLAESQLLRTTDLIERGLTASSGLEQAQSSVDALRANLAALEGQVEAARIGVQNATIKAPMTGIVSERSVEPGQMVAQGTAVFTIVDLTTIELTAAAPVSAGALVKPGQSVAVSVEGIANRTFEGKVERVNPVAAAGTRTIPVYITLDNADGVLRGGMFAVGQITVAEQPDALALPSGAVREDAEGFYVLKVEGDTVVRQGVEKGSEWSAGRLIEITSGISAGDIIVTAVLTQLEPGDRIEMVEN
jgi:membrane fusion protein (multidrug efflux system)